MSRWQADDDMVVRAAVEARLFGMRLLVLNARVEFGSARNERLRSISAAPVTDERSRLMDRDRTAALRTSDGQQPELNLSQAEELLALSAQTLAQAQGRALNGTDRP
jgi:hypothetical protein